MNLFKKTKLKFTIPLILLAFIFIVQSTLLINEHYKKKIYLEQLKNRIIISTKLSKLIHQTQIERGLSVGYSSSYSSRFETLLKKQRKKTDKYIKNIAKFYKRYDIGNYPSIKHDIEIIAQSYDSLNKIRSLIDKHSLTAKQVLLYYSTFNTNILETITNITKTSNISNITQDLISYINFLYFKEYAGIQRALGTEIIIKKLTDISTINEFNTISTKQAVYKNIFSRYATESFQSYYDNILSNDIMHKVKNIKDIILQANINLLNKVNAREWFSYTTELINKLKILDEKLSDKIILNINDKLYKTEKNLILFFIISFISIILFIFLVFILYIFFKNESRLREMIDKYIIFSITDTNGIITDVSKAFLDISGYTKEELIGRSHSIIKHPDMPNSIFKELWQTIKKGHTWHGMIKNLRKNGTYYWVRANIEPIKNIKGKIVAYIAIRQDITDRMKIDHLNKTLKYRIEKEVQKNREKDRQMIQQSRLAQMGEMISMIAHQWRQPLTAISATSQAIMLKATLNKLDKETAIELSKKISSFSQHLSSTIDDFREFFKTNKKKNKVTYSEMIEGVLHIVGDTLKNQNINLLKELDSDLTFDTYPNEVKQVILNLIKNAEDVLIEKNIQNPTIKIKTYENRLSVEDNAGGIPENIIDKIFDPYFSTKTKKDGTGLGLYMSKTIIEEHCDGELRVKNGDQGAVFTIILPL